MVGGMAQITVRYFAAAEEAAGVSEESWDAGGGITLDSLRSGLTQKYGSDMARVLRTGSFLVDGVVRREGEIRGRVVDVLPPFAGG